MPNSFGGFLKPKPDGGRKPMIGKQIITPGTANVPINFGFHDGTGYAQGDANLIGTNILSGKSIFGVAGTARRRATGGGTLDANGNLTVSGLAFTPTVVTIGLQDGSSVIYAKTNNASYSSNAGVYEVVIKDGAPPTIFVSAVAWTMNVDGFSTGNMGTTLSGLYCYWWAYE